MKLLKKSNVAICAILIVLAFLSFFVLAPVFERPETYATQIESLSEKEATLYSLTAAAAVTSAAIAAVPGDSTSAISDAITDLTLFFVISLSAVFLEKYLITVIGMIGFRILIPVACLLGCLYSWLRSRIFFTWAWRLVIFTVVILLALPLSTAMSDKMVQMNETTIQNTINDGELAEEALEETDSKGFFSTITDAVSNFLGGVGQSFQNAGNVVKAKLQNAVSSVAVMLIATCVSPVVALVIVLLAAKFLFGLSYDGVLYAARRFRHDRKSHREIIKDCDTESEII